MGIIKGKVSYLLIGLSFAILAFWLWTSVLDSGWRRRSVHHQIQVLIDQAKMYPDRLDYARELLRRAKKNYGFEATNATVAIGEIGDSAIPIIHEVADLMNSPSRGVAREAAQSLSKLGVRSVIVMDKLVDQVAKFPNDATSWSAANALGEIGAPAVPIIGLLKSRIGTGASQFDDSLHRAIQQLERIKIDLSKPEASASMNK